MRFVFGRRRPCPCPSLGGGIVVGEIRGKIAFRDDVGGFCDGGGGHRHQLSVRDGFADVIQRFPFQRMRTAARPSGRLSLPTLVLSPLLLGSSADFGRHNHVTAWGESGRVAR